jgi:FlaA1/EpsC-like NDP-sugar epimerase
MLSSRDIFNKQRRRSIVRLAGAYCLDWFVFAASAIFAFLLRFDGSIPATYLRSLRIALVIWVVTKAIAIVLAKLNRGNWRYTSSHDATRLFFAITVASLVDAVLIRLVAGPNSVPRSIYALDWLLAVVGALGARLVVRAYISTWQLRHALRDKERTLIYGAGAAGTALLPELHQNEALNYRVVGFIDDDPSKHHLLLYGKPVLGSGEVLAATVRKLNIGKVLIAIPSATGRQMSRILRYVVDAGVDYKTIPGMAELITGADLGRQIRSVDVDDLLGRQPVHLDMQGISAQIAGKVVMVTGAAGSIGSELCRQVAKFHPRAIVGLDAAETPLFHIDRELKRRYPELVFHPEIANITRTADMRRAMEQYRPDVVFHSAAYKHVPLMERHMFAATENNVIGTWNVATVAAECGVADFVMISTDKAVRPTSVMGVTKRIAELTIRALQDEYPTRFVSVRFGNVLGSNGSVVPIFKEQIAAGGPVTITHPEITRFFMTIPEAAQLVMQAFSLGKGGEVFVLDMGEPVKIVDLAKNLIMLSGLRPDRDVQIQFTGLRPGEKLYEELNHEDEHLVPTAHEQIQSYVGKSQYDYREIKSLIAEIQQITAARDADRLMLIFKELVPDYCTGGSNGQTGLTVDEYVVNALTTIPAIAARQ